MTTKRPDNECLCGRPKPTRPTDRPCWFCLYKPKSRDKWGQLLEPHVNVHNEGVQIGCLQRIAENNRLKEDRDWYLTRNAKLIKQVSAYKGIVNRMKKRG